MFSLQNYISINVYAIHAKNHTNITNNAQNTELHMHRYAHKSLLFTLQNYKINLFSPLQFVVNLLKVLFINRLMEKCELNYVLFREEKYFFLL